MRLIRCLLFSAICLSATPSAARLIFVDAVRDGIDGAAGLSGARGVAISADGRHVYAIGAIADAISVFERNPYTGRLRFTQVLRDGEDGITGLDGPVQLALSPDGRSVYVASGGSDAIVVFDRDSGSGRLSLRQTHLGIGAAQGSAQAVWSITCGPDDATVFAGTASGVLIGLARDPGTGALTVADVARNGVDGVTGMTSVDSIAISGDGTRLLAIGAKTFVTFATSGASLTFQGRAQPAVSDGFGTGAVAFAPGGTDVYAVADFSGGVVGLLRASSTPGLLDLQQYVRTGTQGALFTLPRGIAVSPDGAFVFVASLQDAVAAFRRRPDGRIAFSQQATQALDTVFSVAVSPDSRFLYAAGANSNTLATFRIAADEAPLEIPALSPVGVAVLVLGFAVVLARHLRRR